MQTLGSPDKIGNFEHPKFNCRIKLIHLLNEETFRKCFPSLTVTVQSLFCLQFWGITVINLQWRLYYWETTKQQFINL